MEIDLELKEGTCGDWKLSKFSVSPREAQLHLVRCLIKGCLDRKIEVGTYWKLSHNGEVIMTNTPAEVKDHIQFIRKARGKVLVAGLGLGMVLHELLRNPNITKVTVVEISKEVIELTGKFYVDPRLEIINDDIFKFIPSCKYDYGWYDIWNYISSDNCSEMDVLKSRLSTYVKKQSCWCWKECQKLAAMDT